MNGVTWEFLQILQNNTNYYIEYKLIFKFMISHKDECDADIICNLKRDLHARGCKDSNSNMDTVHILSILEYILRNRNKLRVCQPLSEYILGRMLNINHTDSTQASHCAKNSRIHTKNSCKRVPRKDAPINQDVNKGQSCTTTIDVTNTTYNRSQSCVVLSNTLADRVRDVISNNVKETEMSGNRSVDINKDLCSQIPCAIMSADANHHIDDSVTKVFDNPLPKNGQLLYNSREENFNEDMYKAYISSQHAISNAEGGVVHDREDERTSPEEYKETNNCVDDFETMNEQTLYLSPSITKIYSSEQPKSELNIYVNENSTLLMKYECLKCIENEVFSSLSLLTTHMEIHFTKETVACRICAERFTEISMLNTHVKQSHNSQLCLICAEICSTDILLGKHVRTVHKRKVEYQCKVCDKIVVSKSSFFQHAPCNSGKKTHICSFCGKGFARNSERRNHIRLVHEKVKPFMCTICGKSFTFRVPLKTHMVTHSDLRPYLCDICNKSFKAKRQLRRHVNITHSDIRQYECQVCGLKMKTNPILKDHMRIHTGEKPYQCSVCRKTFTHSGSLSQHKKRCVLNI